MVSSSTNEYSAMVPLQDDCCREGVVAISYHSPKYRGGIHFALPKRHLLHAVQSVDPNCKTISAVSSVVPELQAIQKGAFGRS